MSEQRFYCSAESRDRGEELFGTVALVRSWLLLEYSSVWRRHAIDESRVIPDVVKRHILGLERAGQVDRALLIRQQHRRPPPIQCYRIACAPGSLRMQRQALSAYEDLPEASPGENVDGLLFAVCTHGRHDKCCAKFGLPVFCALQEAVGDRAWECSHVGGDRFAGNVVVFPHGIYYGRVRPEHVSEVVRCSRAGEVWLDGYRGRSVYPKAVQVAEYFARRETGNRSIDDFQPLTQRRLPDGSVRVEFRFRSESQNQAIEFRLRADGWRQQLTCDATSESQVPQYELVRHDYIQRPL